MFAMKSLRRNNIQICRPSFAEFLGPKEQQDSEGIEAACFGAPGPVRKNVIQLTNLPWTLDTHELSRDLHIEHIFLINDSGSQWLRDCRASAGPDLHTERGR